MTKARAILGLIILLGVIGVAYAYMLPQSEPDQRRAAGRAVPVVTYTVTTGQFVDRIEALGTVRANESVTLSAQVTEKVTKVNFEDGQLVERGDVLLEFTSEEESALLAEAQATLDEAEQQLARIEGLVKNGNATRARLDDQIRQVKGARAQVSAIEARLADRLLKAPFDGVLGFRRVSPGTLVEPGTPVATLDEIDPVKADFTVPEGYLGALSVGLEVQARSAAYPNEVFRGSVSAIDSRIDPISRTASVRSIIPNDDGRLRPGMLVTIDVVRTRDTVTLVPEEVIIPREDKEYVLVVADDGTVSTKTIETGRRQPGIVEVLSGLSIGESLVAEGVTRARPGGKVRVIGERTLPAWASGGV